MQEVVDRAIQTHGALGYQRRHRPLVVLPAERAARIYDGPDEVHKAVVARRILKQCGMQSHREMPPSTRPVPCEGEQLDVARLQEYLATHLPEMAGPLAVEQFPHGHSNLTYLLRGATRSGSCADLPSEIGSRRPTTWAASIAFLSRLCRVYGPAAAPALFCEDESILGAHST